MRPTTIDDIPLIDALADVFCRYGYEGANLNRLSEASNLKRSSLYHRFPGGKDEIVEAVIARAEVRYQAILAAAMEDGDPAERAGRVAEGLADYYSDGKGSCLIIALTLSDDEGRERGGDCLTGWAEGLEHIARDAGMTTAQAKVASLDAVAAIEGALVVAASTGDTASFDRALAALPDKLTNITQP